MSDFPTGFAVIFDGQRYVPTGLVAHVRQDGVPTKLVAWATHCASCDQPLQVTTSLQARSFPRRCSHCKHQGKPITADERANLMRRLECAQ